LSIKVSVVMAVYNASQFLKPAINSILNQTLEEFEFIIVNDGSTDNSLELIRSYKDERIKIINQENTGVAKARNNGIMIAKTNYIAIQDSDDISNPLRLEKQFNFMVNNKKYIIVGSNAEIIDQDGNGIYFTKVQEKIDAGIKLDISNMPFVGPSIFFKKIPFQEVGGYPDYMENTFEDLILINRLKLKGKMGNLTESLIQYRITATSLTQRNKRHEARLEKIISKAISDDNIENIDINYLRNRLNKLSEKTRKSNYHLFLMKKYLFNNYDIKNAFKNWSKSIYYNPIKFRNYFYFILIILPNYFVKKVYKKLKDMKER